MNTKRSLLILLVVSGIVFVVLNINIRISQVTIRGVHIAVELADTPMEREQGLSARQDLAEGQGMLFVFDTPGRYGFWMKDMNFPIDIIWIDEDRKVVYIKENANPESYPNSFVSTEDAKYVLEVPARFSEKNNIKVGDVIKLEI